MLHSLQLTTSTTDAVVMTSGAVAIQWVLKDGIAEVGKLWFIKSFAHQFDSRPKAFKAFAEVLSTVGSGLQLLTSVFHPQYFLILASSGNILKSISWALWGATHMFFTRNFAMANNISDLTAKSDAQGALAMILGWAVGLVVISYNHSSPFLFGAYSLLVPLHGLATYQLLRSVDFTTLNEVKAVAICNRFVSDASIISNQDLDKEIGLFGEFPTADLPIIQIGVSVESVFMSTKDVEQAISCVHDENYIIGWKRRKRDDKISIGIILHKQAQPLHIFKAIFNSVKFHQLISTEPFLADSPQIYDLLRQSHQWTVAEFPSFVAKLEAKDWDTESLAFDDSGYRCIWELKQVKNTLI